MEDSAKVPDVFGPLPLPDAVWELFARVEAAAPRTIDRLLTHPYVGSWAGYTTRLLHAGTDGVCPLWMHLGYMHLLAAVAAIRAGLDFRMPVPVWNGTVALPSLGLARLPVAEAFSVAEIRRAGRGYVVGNHQGEVRLPDALDMDGPGWWAIRDVRPRSGSPRISVRLDDLDPYRGLYEPVLPQRLADAEVSRWRDLIDEAWRLVIEHRPDVARTMPAVLDTLVPRPHVPYRNPSASTGEAFGSALVGRPADGVSLAGTLVHEFLHIVLGGVMHLIQLYEDDPRERFYVAWRDDPRPLSGALQGAYAFFGVTALWRAFAGSASTALARRSAFEYAYWRRQTWHTMCALRDDDGLTAAGRRFVASMAARLDDWQDEPIPAQQTELAGACVMDHRAGWRVRHLRPDPATVAALREAWLAEHTRAPILVEPTGLPPTPVPDGSWSHARTDLIRLRLITGATELADTWPSVPDATEADYAYATGRYDDSMRGYRTELAENPDAPSALVGLGLSLGARGADPAARALVHRPELVRAVHRAVRDERPDTAPERLAAWIGQLVAG
ncbi:MAG TPA: HEXXH motif domain-containing protein [Actinophytocola sp.]|nr:HEXXH motif domain-containing protein [Actinophytocola sp.]